jgi:hypothetical protein
MQLLYTDRITLTGGATVDKYDIPTGCQCLVFHSLSGATTFGDSSTATDVVTIKQYGKLKLKGNFVGQSVYMNGGAGANVVEVLWTKGLADVDLEGGAIS